MADVDHREKTAPITLLESRRQALLKWLAEGAAAIRDAETSITKHKDDAIAMMAEIDQIEAALNTLNAAQTEPENAG